MKVVFVRMQNTGGGLSSMATVLVIKKLSHLQEIGLIVLGETQKGVTGALPTWHDHQHLRADRSNPSEYLELLVANRLPIRFTATAEDNVSEVNERKGEENVTEDSVAVQEKNQLSARDQMTQAMDKHFGISNDFGR